MSIWSGKSNPTLGKISPYAASIARSFVSVSHRMMRASIFRVLAALKWINDAPPWSQRTGPVTEEKASMFCH